MLVLPLLKALTQGDIVWPILISLKVLTLPWNLDFLSSLPDLALVLAVKKVL